MLKWLYIIGGKTMDELLKIIRQFTKERNWGQFHTKENLAKSISIEAAELLQNYQWSDVETDLINVKEELADVMVYCMMLADQYGFDITEIIKEKIIKNGIKYPVEKAKGISTKYDKL